MKPDFLKECLSSVEPMPLDRFQTAWCKLCGNRECSRSPLNNSAFDVRARDWKRTLFDEPSMADPKDPRYDNLRAKNFSPGGLSVSSVGLPVIDPSIGAPNRGFAPTSFMPRSDVAEAPSPETAAQPAQETAEDAQPAQVPELEAPPRPQTEPEPPDPPPSPPDQPIGVPGNTRFQQGMILGGGEEGAKLGSDQTYVLDDD